MVGRWRGLSICFVVAILGPAWGQPAGPHSISLVIEDGTAQDFVHAQYRPGSTLQLGAEIRDAVGNPMRGGCTPDYKLENAIGPDGVARAWIDAQKVLHFGPPPGARTALGGKPSVFSGMGAFSVSAYCVENPKITSAGNNEAPFNFETSSSRFANSNVPVNPPAPAPAAPAAPADPVAKPGATGAGVLGGLLLAGLITAGTYKLVSEAEPTTGGGSCPTAADVGGCNTTACIPASCGCPSGFVQTGTDNGQRCGSPAGQKLCSCTSTARATRTPTVREFVARGFAQRRELVQPIQRVTRSRVIDRVPDPVRSRGRIEAKVRAHVVAVPRPTPKAPTSPTSSPRVASNPPNLGTFLKAATVAQLIVSRYFSIRTPSTELTPWIQPDAGGLTLVRRF